MNHINYKYPHYKSCKEWLIKNSNRIQKMGKYSEDAFARKLMHIIKYGGQILQTIDFLILQHPALRDKESKIISVAMSHYNLPIIQKYLSNENIKDITTYLKFLFASQYINPSNDHKKGTRIINHTKISNIISYIYNRFPQVFKDKGDVDIVIKTLQIPHIPMIIFSDVQIMRALYLFDETISYPSHSSFKIHGSNLRYILERYKWNIKSCLFLLTNSQIVNDDQHVLVKLVHKYVLRKFPSIQYILDFILLDKNISPTDKIWLLKRHPYDPKSQISNICSIEPKLLDFILKKNKNILHDNFTNIQGNRVTEGTDVVTIYEHTLKTLITSSKPVDLDIIKILLKYKPVHCLSLAIQQNDIDMAKQAIQKLPHICDGYKRYAIQYHRYDILQLMI